MSNRRISTEGYAKPNKPKKPKKPKPTPAGQPARPYSFKKVKANTSSTSYRPTYDPREGARVNQLKPGRGGAVSAVGMGGMFNIAPWQKQKTK